ncbi:hypothetical protein FRB94_013588 [Tulasnella sp. JGI-2019a]|nr:hypothetical protein FRB94_013588 [Tulasnella sp. JGI-2019a]KAG9030936.1 hypothetical protein FRB95_003320 [Tulasnella sp. JGI-2019a]
MGKTELDRATTEIEEICSQSGKSQYCNVGSSPYYDSIRHYLESSTEYAKFAVQPADVSDLSAIMKVLAKYNVNFAIKCGGHAMNPGFSSTMGVQIYMTHFSKVTYLEEDQTVDVEGGCTWDSVYAELAKYERNVVGGASVSGVGVAGYLLGGGYSLKTNRYGLAIDHITEMEVILPDGEVRVVNKDRDSDLFKAFKGGGNNFGIVTRFRLETHHQGKAYGTSYSFEEEKDFEKVKIAMMDFISTEKRPEAAMVAAFRHNLVDGKPKATISVLCVFDGPQPSQEEDPWQRFDSIRKGDFTDDPAGWKRLAVRHDYRGAQAYHARNYFLSLDDLPNESKDDTPKKDGKASQFALLGTGDSRGRFGCIMVNNFTKTLIDTVASEAEEAAKHMNENKGKLIVLDVWPFLPTIFDNSTPSAWPHTKGNAFFPLLAYFLWEKKSDDQYWLGRMQQTLENIHKVAVAEHCINDSAPAYLNTSLEYTPVENIYRTELKELSELRAKYDPTDVMRRTCGFKIPLPSTVTSPIITLKRLKVEGFYTYRNPPPQSNPEQSDDNRGFEEFSLDYDTSSSTIQATGEAKGGFFSITGVLKGKYIRFIKSFTDKDGKSWQFAYIGEARPKGAGVYEITGAWGDGGIQQGSFAFTALELGGTGRISSGGRAEGVWKGSYKVSGGTDQNLKEVPTGFSISTRPNYILVGHGQDGLGPFNLVGSYTEVSVTLVKSYEKTAVTWVLSGSVDRSGTRLRGTWGAFQNDQWRTLRTFKLTKGRSVRYEQSKGFMPSDDKLWGKAPKDLMGFLDQKNFKGDISPLVEGFSKLS